MILKFPINLVGVQFIEMPAPLKLLTVDNAGYLYALCSFNAPREQVPIKILITGDTFDDWIGWEYLCSVKYFHIFYRDPNKKK